MHNTETKQNNGGNRKPLNSSKFRISFTAQQNSK